MRLVDLIEPLAEKRLVGGDAEIRGMAYDSRAVHPSELFVAIRGGTFDGHIFVADAIGRGAAAVVAEQDVRAAVPVVVVPSSRAALAALAAEFYDYPSRRMVLVGVTGTNGKTTTTHLVQSIFRAAGRKAGLIGTLGARIGGELIETHHTTPESSDLQQILARMAGEGVQAVAMEVSSHGLVQGRTAFCEFDCGVFTNLTQDHLDFHRTLDEYLAAKLILFRDYPERSDKRFVAAVNLDDPAAGAVIEAARGDVITFGMNGRADVVGSEVKVGASGVSLVITYRGRSERAKAPVGGHFNAYNCLAAAAACLGLGTGLDAVVKGLAATPRVPGRFESIDCGQAFGVLVDYAHTPDGLENVLKTTRELTRNRLIVVFGCGGNRDRGKRPIMGRIASELADTAIITSDNPRKEDPNAIIRDILEGVPLDARPEVVADRRQAIERAVMQAAEGDLVVIAGKGHEDYQIFADRTIHFDDREVAREVLRDRERRDRGEVTGGR